MLASGKQKEVGIKNTFWDGRGEWTLAGYEIVKNNLLTRDPNFPNDPNKTAQQKRVVLQADPHAAAPDLGVGEAKVGAQPQRISQEKQQQRRRGQHEQQPEQVAVIEGARERG